MSEIFGKKLLKYNHSFLFGKKHSFFIFKTLYIILYYIITSKKGFFLSFLKIFIIISKDFKVILFFVNCYSTPFSDTTQNRNV